jgi:archaellum biogenesis protein FlaJ (TadC family)
MKVQFNMVTMKDGKINVEEKPELSELLSQAMNEDKEEKSYLNESMKEAIKTHGEFMKRKKERAMELPEGFYKNDKNSEFFTSSLETMKDIITDEVKRDKILQRISEGAKFGTFRRYKTQQPMLVKAYKTRKGADQNTFWRNR